MVILLTFLLAGHAPETLAVVRDPETCATIARVLNAALDPKTGGVVICRETRATET